MYQPGLVNNIKRGKKLQKVITGMFMVIMSIVLTGCGTTVETIKQKTQNARTDVFTERERTMMPLQRAL